MHMEALEPLPFDQLSIDGFPYDDLLLVHYQYLQNHQVYPQCTKKYNLYVFNIPIKML